MAPEYERAWIVNDSTRVAPEHWRPTMTASLLVVPERRIAIHARSGRNVRDPSRQARTFVCYGGDFAIQLGPGQGRGESSASRGLV